MSNAAELVPIVRGLVVAPVGTIRSVRESRDARVGVALVLLILAVKVGAHLLWQLLRPNVRFGLMSSITGWAGYLAWLGAWVAALWFFSKRTVPLAGVFNGVTATQVVPVIIAAVVTFLPSDWGGLRNIIWSAEAIYWYVALALVARDLADGEDAATFRLMLFGGVIARTTSVLWSALF